MLTTEQQALLKSLLIDDEGRVGRFYTDSLGHTTAGIGHLCEGSVSDAIIDQWYEEDWQKAYNFLVRSFSWFGDLDFPRKYALISMVFNMGGTHFLEFKRFIAAMAAKSYAVATAEMLNSTWAKQVPNRASKLAKIISTGELP